MMKPHDELEQLAAAAAAAIHHESAPSAGAIALAKLTMHEEICSIRYTGIIDQVRGVIDRVGRLEKVILSVAGALLLGMAGVIMSFLMHKGG